MKTSNPSPRDELAEPLRSILEDIATGPVPVDLIQSARQFSVLVPPKTKSQRSALVIVVSILALSLCIAALVVREEPSSTVTEVAENNNSSPRQQNQIMPPPTFWVYRQAHSAEALDELLSQHAAMLLSPTPSDHLHPFQPFSRKDEL